MKLIKGRYVLLLLAFWLLAAKYYLQSPPPYADLSQAVYYGDGKSGKVCTGLESRPSQNHWLNTHYCPEGFGIYAVDDPGGENAGGDGKKVPVIATCCELPSKDILLDEHVYAVSDHCPENYVATSTSDRMCDRQCMIRCTKINTAKYRLAPKQNAVYWRQRWETAYTGWGSANQVSWDEIPIAIRYSVGRERELNWDIDGCIGLPFGSLLVGKEDKDCGSFFFSVLQFVDGSPVPMFPLCERLGREPGDEYLKDAVCVPPEGTAESGPNKP